jgi:hypothetical protein
MYNWDDPINEALNKPEEVKAPPVIREQPKESSKIKSESTVDVNEGIYRHGRFRKRCRKDSGR